MAEIKFLLSFIFGVSFTAQVMAGEQRIVLREHLKQPWTNELLTYAFSADEGMCRAELVTLAGPRGFLPVQLSQVKYWAGTEWVKTAKLSFIASLAPLAEDAYTIRYGTEPATASVAATDLRVTPGNGQVEITTERFAVRLLLGERTYAEPVSAAEVPGPVAAMRLGDGTWFGGSRLFGKTKVKSYAARLTAAGPLFAHVEFVYTYEDGNTVRLLAEVAAGDNAVLWDAQAKENRPGDGWDLLLSPGLAPLIFRVQMEFWTKREIFIKRQAKVGDSAELRLDEHPPGLVTNLTPWPDWFDDYTQTSIPLKISDRDSELRINSRDVGVWVKPVEFVGRTTPPPGATKVEQARAPSPSLREKLMPLMRGENGEVFLRMNAAAGQRRWNICDYSASVRNLRAVEDRTNTIGPQPHGARELEPSPVVGRRLNVVKDFVLDWPEDPRFTHPFVFLSRAQLETTRKRPADKALLDSLRNHKTVPDVPHPSLDTPALGAYLLTGDPAVAAETKVVERLRHHLGLLGHFDKMRNVPIVVALYDALVDSNLVTPEERQVLRAQMAYLGYNLADPYSWSHERGYASGNPNMTVAFVLNLALVACAMPEHPMARAWTQPAMKMMEHWLNELGPKGEHPESVANYANVSVYNMLGFAIAAKNAGLHDYINDPRMKRLMLYLAKQYTPCDPRYGGFSKLPPAGRGPHGVRTALAGLMARATQQSDPEYSRAQQWVWQREGYSYLMEGRLGGYEHVCADRHLPAARPDWGTELFPGYGIIFRNGLGTKDEYYVNLQVHMRDGYPSPNGSFPVIFAKGAPISTVFVHSYKDREELLVSRVLPARKRGTLEERRDCWYHEEERTITDFASLGRQDYAAIAVTINGPRPATHHLGGEGKASSLEELSCVQMPEWPHVPAAGKPPVTWRRQVLFAKDDDPASANYLLLRDTVSGGQPTMWQFFTLSEKIGTPDEARNPEAFLTGKPGNKAVEPSELKGDRFTALGQFGVDVEYFVASPADTPRYTLRCGEKVGNDVYQDLLHLQRPNDGAYYVALFPRRRNDPVPSFSTLGNGTIIKVTGDFGTDYGFLSALPGEAASEGVTFKGTAASVQDRKSGLVLTLGAKGEVRYKGYGLSGDHAASLRVGEGRLLVEQPTEHAGAMLTLTAPDAWVLEKPVAGVKLDEGAQGRFTLTVPKGVASVTLGRR